MSCILCCMLKFSVVIHTSPNLPQVLRETLQRHGFVFESDTDTEVIPKLAKFVYDTMRNPSTSPTTSPAPPGFSNGKTASTSE